MPMRMDDHAVYVYASFDELEILPRSAERPIEFDALAWVGGDFNRLWAKARGGQATAGGGTSELEGQFLYGRVLSPYWDVQAGVRMDARREGGRTRTRSLLAVGLQGLAPYWFELEPTLFASQDGDLSARLEARYELSFTQRLILEPELRMDVALQGVPEFGVGTGVSSLEAGVRARYEIVRELAPYLGVTWLSDFGRGANPARATFVAGLRAWY